MRRKMYCYGSKHQRLNAEQIYHENELHITINISHKDNFVNKTSRIQSIETKH